MKKTYVKPIAETIDFAIKESLTNDILDGSAGLGDADDLE